jgi:hypothetical protein
MSYRAMNREIGTTSLALYLDRGDGTSSFGQSGLNMSKADNQPARICIVEDDPIIGDYLRQHDRKSRCRS